MSPDVRIQIIPIPIVHIKIAQINKYWVSYNVKTLLTPAAQLSGVAVLAPLPKQRLGSQVNVRAPVQPVA